MQLYSVYYKCLVLFCAVIDFCLVKQLMCDWQTKYVCLKTVLASQAALTQRKGRAGRVARGRCYRMIKRSFYKKHMPEYTTPEMLVSAHPLLMNAL